MKLPHREDSGHPGERRLDPFERTARRSRVLLSLASLGVVVATVIAAGVSSRLHRLFEPPSVYWLAAALAVAAVTGVLWLRARNE